MMWLVRIALRLPYTFVVMAILISILGIVTIFGMSTDILPEIDIPVVSVIWQYDGMAAEEMERRVVTYSERAITTTVNDIEHMESQSMFGVGVIKVFFHPRANIAAAVAQVTSISQTILRILPPGIQPPLIVQYSASNVPIVQIAASSSTLTEAQLYDYGLNFIRTQLATVQGAQVPLPYGGKPRQIMVDLDQQALLAKGLSASDVTNAVNAQNLILPAGSAKMGTREYSVRLNSSPEAVSAINDFPIRQVNGAMIYIRDVAQVRDGFGVQTNVVRQDGRRSSLMTVLKSVGASTLDIVRRVRETLPRIQATLPPELNLQFLFDQSVFVRAAVQNVLHEGVIAAGLTGLMILLFLGSWRSTLVVALSIPLSILTSVIVLNALGQTLNLMTLGGLALAVGVLVDDATVEVENIHRNLGQRKEMNQAILDGAQQIATPTFVSTLSICIVFVPIFFLTGIAHYLFTPLAMAVVFAMLASYLLTRTLVPTMVRYLLKDEAHIYFQTHDEQTPPVNTLLWRIHRRFNHAFERFRAAYQHLLALGLQLQARVFVRTVALGLICLALLPAIGRDFFPRVDAGEFRLHVRAPAGTRVEETERLFGQVEDVIRRVIPAKEVDTIIDNIGLPVGGVNLAFSDSSTIGAADGEILVSLNKQQHGPTWDYVKELRRELNAEFPELTFFFQASDIVTQILNFGLPAPIDIQVVGRDPNNYKIAQQIDARVSQIPGVVDAHVHQVVDTPELRVNVDRTRAEQIGLTQQDVANTVLYSLSSSGQAARNYWLNPQNGVTYLLAVQTPQNQIDSVDALQSTPVVVNGQSAPQLLSNLATINRGTTSTVVNHYNVQPVFDVFLSVQGRSLGAVAREVDQVIADVKKDLPRGTFITMRGQVQSMRSSFWGLGLGILFALVLVYLLMVVNFQSWTDPLIIIMALPGAMFGVLWTLFVTQTTFNVPSLMGTIMVMGLATANSILVVTFANDLVKEGKDARTAALEAGFTRLRPVMMTAIAMIIGMTPMALGLGEGGEQNAPLGRAVIGGLVGGTFATLFFVPVVYSLLRRRQPQERSDEKLA
jgi:CzcA family heavy metal efflux pump